MPEVFPRFRPRPYSRRNGYRRRSAPYLKDQRNKRKCQRGEHCCNKYPGHRINIRKHFSYLPFIYSYSYPIRPPPANATLWFVILPTKLPISGKRKMPCNCQTAQLRGLHTQHSICYTTYCFTWSSHQYPLSLQVKHKLILLYKRHSIGYCVCGMRFSFTYPVKTGETFHPPTG